MELCNARLHIAGEHLAIDNGGAAIFFLPSGGRAPFLPLSFNLSHPIRIRRLRAKNTPSWGNLLKRPPRICKSDLQSSAHLIFPNFDLFYSKK
jgi:hypothetical protein